MKDNDENNVKKPEERENKLIKFIEKNNTAFTLSLVIFIVIVWALIKMNNMQKTARVEKQQLTKEYESRLDNLSISSMELTARVFSWAIRGEMIRQNLDQVNQYFTSFIREPDIVKIQLIDPSSGKIILSTDKKDEGIVIEETLILQAERTFHIPGDQHVKIISPVMGLSARIGVLVIEYNINSSHPWIV